MAVYGSADFVLDRVDNLAVEVIFVGGRRELTPVVLFDDYVEIAFVNKLAIACFAFNLIVLTKQYKNEFNN